MEKKEVEEGKIKNVRWEVEERDMRSTQSRDVHWLKTYCHMLIGVHLARDVSWARTT